MSTTHFFKSKSRSMAEQQKQQRIAELKSQMAREQNAEKQSAQENQSIGHLQHNVLKAMEQIESSLDDNIHKMQEVENLREDELDLLRDRRRIQLKQEQQKRDQLFQLGHGGLTLCTDEKEFFTMAKQAERMVVHFYRDTTARCQVLDAHLSHLARQHIGTKFVKVNVERSPFLCERLKIHTLPSLVLVIKGKTEKTLIGFDEFGGDECTTKELESCLVKYHVLERGGAEGRSAVASKPSVKASSLALDDDWED